MSSKAAVTCGETPDQIECEIKLKPTERPTSWACCSCRWCVAAFVGVLQRLLACCSGRWRIAVTRTIIHIATVELRDVFRMRAQDEHAGVACGLGVLSASAG
jgi:hypothetical protein